MALMRICEYIDDAAMDEITILQAEVLKTLANPRRLEIIHRLAQGPARSAGWPRRSAPASPTSRSTSRSCGPPGIVDAERDGREVRYRLADPDVIVACNLMRGVLQRRLTRLGRLSHLDQAAAELIEIQ